MCKPFARRQDTSQAPTAGSLFDLGVLKIVTKAWKKPTWLAYRHVHAVAGNQDKVKHLQQAAYSLLDGLTQSKHRERMIRSQPAHGEHVARSLLRMYSHECSTVVLSKTKRGSEVKDLHECAGHCLERRHKSSSYSRLLLRPRG